jgi:predicted transcriptional regulator
MAKKNAEERITFKIVKKIFKKTFSKGKKTEDYIIKTVDKAIDVVEYLAKENEPKKIMEIARAIDLPHNQVFRILQTLIIKGWVKQNIENTRYSLTKKLTDYPKLIEEMEKEQASIAQLSQSLKLANKRLNEIYKKEKEAKELTEKTTQNLK